MSENLIETTPNSYRGTHIVFALEQRPKGRKTDIWLVASNEGIPLGEVSWFARWRKYAFFPLSGCVFEETCLQELATFCVYRTREHKQQKAA